MPDDRPSADLYESDFYAWTQAQAAALRAGAGSNLIEYERVAEEIEDLGGAQRNAVQSQVRNIIRHLLELEYSRAVDPRLHWKTEVVTFRDAAAGQMTGALRRSVEEELETLHRQAGRTAQKLLDLHEPGSKIDKTRRWSLPAILGEGGDPLDTMK